MNQPQTQADFQKFLIDGVHHFGKVFAANMNGMFGTAIREQGPRMGPMGIDETDRIFISILFTGTIYGEYVIALEEATAARILGMDLTAKSESEAATLRTEINQTFAELLNVTVGECIKDLGSVYEKLTITSPRVFTGHLVYPRVHNSRMSLECDFGQLEVILYVDRMKIDVAASYRDALSSLEVAHVELQNAMRRLQDQQCVLVQTEKMASLGVMAAGIAHEINTPLATISLVSERLKGAVEETSSGNSISQMLDIIDRTAHHISQITHGLRMFSRGGQNEPLVSHPFSEVIKNSALLCKTYLSDKNVKMLVSEIPPGLECECRVSQSAQVILNLVRNAADAMDKSSDRWIKLDVITDAKTIEMRVTDSGSGIPEAIRTKIFDPFFSTKDVGKGTGLGLSISKGLIEEHGGTISIDSKSPNTCFIVRLPLSQPKAMAV